MSYKTKEIGRRPTLRVLTYGLSTCRTITVSEPLGARISRDHGGPREPTTTRY